MAEEASEPDPETVLITGASRGLGHELALQFAERGTRVLAGVRNPASCETISGVEFFRLDLRNPDSIDALQRVFTGQPIDIVINNAAIRGDVGGLETLEPEAFLDVMRVNALGALQVARAAKPLLQRGRRKLLVNISSRAGSMQEGTIDDDDGDYAYRCSKAALNMVTRKLAHDFRQEKIAVVSLHPGWIRTDMGGYDAQIPPGESAAGLISLIDGMTMLDTGSFRAFDGSMIAW